MASIIRLSWRRPMRKVKVSRNRTKDVRGECEMVLSTLFGCRVEFSKPSYFPDIAQQCSKMVRVLLGFYMTLNDNLGVRETHSKGFEL